MKLKKEYKGAKPAQNLMQWIMIIAVGTVVLLYAFGIIDGNFNLVASKSGINNLTNSTNNDARTNAESWGTVSSPIQTQENVQIVADQGLDRYTNKAQRTLDRYMKDPNSAKYNVGIQRELARAALILAIANGVSCEEQSILEGDPYNMIFDTGYSSYTVTLSNGLSIGVNINNYSGDSDTRILEMVRDVDRAHFTNS